MTKVFSMFSGIGGFELGLLMSEKKVRLVGYSEIDKYAVKIFEKQLKGIKNYGNATTIDETKLPNFDLLVGGFPCQAFSVAGKQRGFNDTRGTLFFDVARILKHKKPKHFILENVKGLLSHDSGRTFQTILKVLSDIGYDCQWEVLNSKNYGVPQNRERVYIIGHLRGSSRPEVFPIGKINEENSRNNKPKEITKDMSMAYRVYDINGVSTTLRAHGGGVGAKTGLYQVTNKPKTVALIPEEERPKGNYLPRERILSDEHISRAVSTSESQHPYYQVKVSEATSKGYAVAEEGDSINLSVPNSKTRRGRVGKQVAQTLDTGMQQYTIQTGVKVENSFVTLTEKRTDEAKRIRREVRKETGRDFSPRRGKYLTKRNDGLANCVTAGQGMERYMTNDVKIRRLTPTECERLQGFPDGWTEGLSDTQRYKCLGNAVTTNVVCEIAKRLLK